VHPTKTQGPDDDDEDIDIQIEGLTETYCDDFVCTSSPAIEQTLRSLAKDLVRRRWTPVLFARDVKYRVRVSLSSLSEVSVPVLYSLTSAILLQNPTLEIYRPQDAKCEVSMPLQDSYRRFSGAERHKRLLHISNNVKDAKVVRLCWSSDHMKSVQIWSTMRGDYYNSSWLCAVA